VTERAAIASALRVLADALEAEPVAPAADPWLDLAALRDAGGPVAPDTARRWVASGRLRACTAERGRLVFRQSWLDAAIEAEPVRPGLRAVDDVDTDPLEQALRAGDLAVTR